LKKKERGKEPLLVVVVTCYSLWRKGTTCSRGTKLWMGLQYYGV